MKLNRRQALTALSAAGQSPALWAQKAPNAAALPVEDFFQKPGMTQIVLNPSGTQVAMLTRSTPKSGLRLVVVDLATLQPRTLVAYADADVTSVYWANDQRLVFFIDRDEDTSVSTPFGRFAIDANGANPKPLPHGVLLRQGPQTGEHVLLQSAQDTSEGAGFLALKRVSAVTGRGKHTHDPDELDVPPWSIGFLLDPEGEPVAALTARGDTARLHWRENKGDGSKNWRMVREMPRFYGADFSLLAMGPDGTVYVTARKGHDQAALYTYNPQTNQLSDKPLLLVDQFDVNPSLVFGKGRLLGAHIQADAITTVWFDADAKALQATIDERLPATANQLQMPSRGDSPWVLVWAFSDVQPVQALVYNQTTRKLTRLGHSMPHIEPAQMSTMDYTPFKARDGRTIPAYLTVPRHAPKGKTLPLVVLVHGGPFVRGASWHWDAEVQFLASRGYAVLQPEFRGSTGFGESHFKAGWKQWGQAMQDDLADAARWAVSKGVADPARVAVMGASYGGYAALMGLAKQADVFACAVNWIGVTDLDLLYGAHWSDQPGVFKRYGLPKTLGDRKDDAEMLKAHSPIQLASRITKPVLMAYGKRDLRVPIEHGERMRDALQAHNKQVEWVRYDDEGHGWRKLETNKDFWGRVERFLGQHLKA